MSKTYIRTARKGETSRPIIIFKGQTYETLASPTFIFAGQKVRVQVLSSVSGSKRILVAPVGSEGWEKFEAQD